MRIIIFFNLLICVFSDLINKQSLSTARYLLSSSSLPSYGLAFFAGGFNGGALNIIDYYNITSNKWGVYYLSSNRYLLSATSLDTYGMAFFSGGIDNTPTPSSNLDIFYATNNSWVYLNLNIPRYAHASTFLKDMVFFGGGKNLFGVLSSVECFNITSYSWNIIYLNKSSHYLSATTLSDLNTIFFFGGLDSQEKALQNVDEFLFTNNTIIHKIKSMNNPGAKLCVSSINKYNGLLIAGNMDTSCSILQPSIDKIITTNQNLNRCISTQMYNSSLVFFGNQYDNINIFDFESMNVYSESTFFPTKYIFGSATSLNNIVLFAGGYISEGVVFSGTYSKSIIIYSICPRGSYYQINPNGCVVCPNGTFCGKNSIAPQICPQGSFCNNGIRHTCPDGTYSNNPGADSLQNCSQCKDGIVCSYGDVRVCPSNGYCKKGIFYQCPLYAYAQTGSTNLSDCLYCPSGKYYDQIYNECINCGLGFICTYTAQLPCPQNFYCPSPVQKYPCPAGTYSDTFLLISASQCINCPMGYYCSGNGNTKLLCDPGTYSANEGNSACVVCPAGYFCPLGSKNPFICDENKYSLQGSVSCTNCLIGQFTKEKGASACEDCPSSQLSFNGLWCMTVYEKIIFVFVWLGSIFSAVVTIWKIYKFCKNRLHKMKENEIQFSIKNFIFLNKILKYNIKLFDFTDKVVENEPLLITCQKEVKTIKENIEQIKTKLQIYNLF